MPRCGTQPDGVVRPTVEGIRERRGEVLEEAMVRAMVS